MRKVIIQYRPFKKLKFTRYFKGNFPSTWEETTPKQLIAIACLLKRSISDVQFLSVMTGLSKRIINRLDNFQRFQLIELFDTFHSNKPYNEFIIQELNCKTVTLHRPKPKLKGVTFGQYIFIATHFANYQESSDIKDLNKFIAATYLPHGLVFNENLIEEYSPFVNKLDLLTKEAIVINYHLIRDWLCEVYPMVFQKQEEQTEKENTENTQKKKPIPKRDPNSWIKVFDGLVGDDIINEDNYANLPMHNIFRYLTNQIKANAKRK